MPAPSSPGEHWLARLGLSQQAQIDLLRIAEYGVELWGAGAADRFVASFDGAFALINRHPDIGRERDDIGPNARSWLHRGHIVYYEHGATIFEVRRILHAAADPLIDESE